MPEWHACRRGGVILPRPYGTDLVSGSILPTNNDWKTGGVTLILYTYSCADSDVAARWRDTDLRNEFFPDLDEVKQAVLELRDEVMRSDPATPWMPVRIERIEIAPIEGPAVLTLLNEGVGPLVRAYEIVEMVD
ncbi:hypothetical protein [Aquamicrobium defluvii]|uniref:Uncharacterized protein n=1 Tax=Aquamicrobium defluvii TaxID=69279 RepID=A0A4R6Y1Q2_9HYPH|nr:hypothetical protein [Aquamicrobium defluvii]MCK9468519.1 hypothetical protein [Porticoccaceae bacterium]TDR30368.1 hypothetical protein DES43_1456 [Aquamicrobium defluvii]